MKKDNINNLIAMLVEANDWLPANILAVQLHTTSRSVRNYVAQINSDKNKQIIIASRFGYKLNWENIGSFDIISTTNNSALDNPRDRCWFLIRALLYVSTTHNLEPLSLDKTCEILSISDSTLATDLVLLRKMLSAYNIRLHIKNEVMSISGNEIDFRHLLYGSIINSFQSEPFSRTDIKKLFPHFKIDDIEIKLIESIAESGLKIDAYHQNSLLLHVTIQIIRLSDHNCVTSKEVSISNLHNSLEYRAAELFVEKIQSIYPLSFSWREIYYLTILFHCFCFNDQESISHDCEIEKNVRNSLAIISKREDIAFDESFIITSIDFFERLKIRCYYKLFADNPLKSAIRNTSINIFDEVVWMSTTFMELWNLDIPRSEIAFYALILLGYLRNHKPKRPKISCTLVCPDYFGYQSFIVNHLQSHFENQIYFKQVIDDLNNNDYLPSDLTISVFDLKNHGDFINITPQLTASDYEGIRNRINLIETKKRYKDFSMYLNCYSSAQTFERNHYFENAQQAIDYMCDRLKALNYVDDHFVKQLLLRERADSTAYHNFIAVPHANVAGVKTNSIYIILNDKPINWGKRKANLIVMIAMQRELLLDFRYFYEILIKLFEDKKNNSLILKAKDYDEFVSIVNKLDANIL